MQDLEGKVAFITGGGSGVALGQAKVFAEEAGMKVVIADVRQDRLDEALSYFKTKCSPTGSRLQRSRRRRSPSRLRLDKPPAAGAFARARL